MSQKTAPTCHQFCTLAPTPERQFDSSLEPGRLSLLRSLSNKWVDGTKLHYAFFEGHQSWDAADAQKNVVHQAFRTWKEVGIGLEFEHVTRPEEAEIRIGFEQGDGSWSALGRDCLNRSVTERTMNLGWDITVAGPNGLDTAIHEIGHALGFPHEHQNPNAGIVWDDEAVYAALAAPPNRWSRDKTYYNILRKLPPHEFEGSNWDRDSIMHYAFPAGLIVAPADATGGISPAPGLSPVDKGEVRKFYPALDHKTYPKLEPLDLKTLDIQPGEQLNFVIRPKVSERYNFRTFGNADTVMTLFEGVTNPRFLAGDDDGGTDLNASLEERLFADREYVLRLRLYWKEQSGKTALMMW